MANGSAIFRAEEEAKISKKENLACPVLKWAGGKRQLLELMRPLFPSDMEVYCEPFVGGGAVLFDLQPDTAYVNDVNSDLIRVYMVIRDSVDDLVAELKTYQNTAEDFYRIRDLDRNKEAYNALSDVQKAARVLYLNKTCYNGLYRVNSKGEFNAPYGKYKNPNIVNESILRAVSAYFNSSHIHFFHTDYADVLKKLPDGPGTFVYLDPPYDPISETAGFTGYSKGGFTKADQERLKECCDDLDERGIKFMLSNSATNFILNLYMDYDMVLVKASRAINCVGEKRGNVLEVVVKNYGDDNIKK